MTDHGDDAVLVHGAEHRDTDVDELPRAAFIDVCVPYFANGGVVIDEPFQRQLTDGSIRVYLVIDKVVGFSDKALTRSSPTQRAPPASWSCRH